jgi:Rod binding domain-containing protein
MAQLPLTHQPVGKAEKAARDFEGILLGSLLDSLQKTFSGIGNEEGSLGSGNYAAMGTQALGSAISAHGGIGIAQLILHQWRQTKVPSVG